MKKLVKVITVTIAFTTLNFALFAQTSNTANVTNALFAQTSKTANVANGLFTTDVDNYLSVHNWNKVQPKNLFVDLEFQKDLFDFGLAKQFENCYLGASYEGNLFEGSKKEKNDYVTFGNNNFSCLLGIKDRGIKLDFTSVLNESYDTQREVNPILTKDNVTSVGLYAGTTVNKEKVILTPIFGVSFTGALDSVTTEYDEGDEIIHSDQNLLVIIAGSGFEFPKKGMIKHSLNLEASGLFCFYPKIIEEDKRYKSTVEQKKNLFTFILSPAYTAEVAPVDKLTLKSKVTFPITITSYKEGDEIQTYDGNETTLENDYKLTSFELNPELTLAMQYNVKPEKLNINLAATFKNDGLAILNENDNGTKTDSFKFGDNLETTLSTGFSYNIAKTVLFDFQWNILKTSNEGANTSGSTIWSENIYAGILAKF